MDSICEKLKNTVDSIKDKVENFIESKIPEKHSIGIISAPLNKGDPNKGTEKAPSAIKDTGFIQKLRDSNFDVEDFGNLPMQSTLSLDIGPIDKMQNFKQVMEYNQLMSQKIKGVIQKKNLCITLGGDHAITIGCVNGLADSNRNHQVKLIYVDAHADVTTGSSCTTKHMSDNVISFLLNRETNRYLGWPSPSLNYNDIVWIGLREIEPSEQVFLDSSPDLLYFNEKDVKTRGIETIMKCCLEKLNPGPESPLYISFDIDALDPSIAPSTVLTEASGGLTMEDGKTIVQSAFCTGYLRGLDICHVNPTIGSESDAKKTAMAACNLILSIAEKNETKIC